MKRIPIKSPDIKGGFQKLKNLKPEDIKRYWRKRKERKAQALEKRRNSPFARKMEKYYGVMNRLSLVFHALLACALNLVMEMISRHSLSQGWNYMLDTPKVFLYNSFLIWVTFSFVYLVRRRIFARIVISVLWLLLGVTNGYMLMKRVTPFNAQDLKVAGDAVTLISSYFDGIELVLVIVGVAAVIVWVVSMWRQGGQYTGRMNRLVSLAGVIASFALFFGVTNLALEKRVISNYFGNIAFAYQDYGLPYCFMSSVFNTGISQPNGYSEETIAKITDDGRLRKAKSGRKDYPNIVFIQLESFFDTEEAEFFETSEDPLPNFRKLSEEYSSGYFKVPSVGAGTANTEFEVLTGMNLRYFGPGEYPYKTILKKEPAESAATALKTFGYGAHALHNNGGNFYSRAKVFNNIGFDSYTSKEFMNILQLTENGWAKDDILIKHIMESMDSTKMQDFVFGITVQSHGDYYNQTLKNPRIKVSGIEDEGVRSAWEYYVNQIYEVDEFVGNLVRALENRGEPTVLVLYGDHLPTLGLKSEDLKSRYLYNTNYVVWDNIGLKKQDRNIASYQIMADVFEKLDLHAGTVFNYHQTRRQTKDYLLDLELLQYDILYGEKYVYGGENPFPQGNMQMGVKDVSLTDIVGSLDGRLSLYGENFTKNSKVYVNGEKQKSTFLNNTRIELLDTELAEEDIVTVSQVGSSNTIFRTSAEYMYHNGRLAEVTDAFLEQLEKEKEEARKQKEKQRQEVQTQSGQTSGEKAEETNTAEQ